MVSSRQIERACGENILFMALSCGYQPDHSTIAHFISSMQKQIESIFGNILLVCAELDLLGGTHFSLDGVKLSSNASKEWSGTFKELEKKRDKLQGKLLKCGARAQLNRYRVYDIYRARQEDCASCRLRTRCLSGKSTSRRYLSIRVDGHKPNLIDEMKAKIDTLQGKQIYSRRLAIVEPVFANICVQKRLDRFTLRTKDKVDVQWRLFALVHHIGKIHNYGLIN